MKRLLLNCDQVFDVLTRGPFPTGEPEDEAVEQHLRACHDCRRLAEALRPAVALLHEVIAADQALDLPEYQGSLAPHEPESRRLGVVRLATGSKRDRRSTISRRPDALSDKLVRAQRVLSAVRFLATALVVAAIAALLYGIAVAPSDGSRGHHHGAMVAGVGSRESGVEGLPGEQGLLTLASLKLPTKCLPLTHRAASTEQAAQIAAALANGSLAKLHCCTECHHAGLTPSKAAHLVAVNRLNCQACHRG